MSPAAHPLWTGFPPGAAPNRLRHAPLPPPLLREALQTGLAARGFEVLRLNTYDTVPVSSLEAAKLEAAKQAAVVTVGSPSAIK